MRTPEEITDLANSLNNNEFVDLFNHFANRCDLFIGTLGKRQISSEVNWACLNGSVIQINAALSDLDSLIDSQWIRHAMLEAVLPQAHETEGGNND